MEAEPCSLTLDWGSGGESDVPYWWDCADATAASVLQPGHPEYGKLIGDNEADVSAEAWEAWVGKTCSGLGMNAERIAEEEGMLLRRWEASLSAILEHELWTGQVAQAAGFADNPFLADSALATNLGGNFGFVTALAELEQGLADAVSLGARMIHAQPRLVTAWAAEKLVEVAPDRTHLRTLLGTVVVPGSGYDGTDPNGIAASYSHTYAYGTGQVKAFVADPAVTRVDASSVKRSTNAVELRAAAPALVLFNPCTLVTVGVNLCDRYCGGAS